MFTYIINEQKVTFATIEEAMPALEEAEKMGWTVVEVAFGEKEKPKKNKQGEDSTEVSKAPAERSIIEKITSPNFVEDLAISAIDGSDVLAQPELESSSEDTSLDLPAVTIESTEEFKEENSVISQEAAEDIFSADNNRIKEALQTLAKNQKEFTYTEKQAGGRSEGSYHPIATLTYTDAAGMTNSFEADIANLGITGDQIKQKGQEFKSFVDLYGDKEILQTIGAQAETLYQEQFTPTDKEVEAALEPISTIFEPRIEKKEPKSKALSYYGEKGAPSLYSNILGEEALIDVEVYPYDKELEAARNQLIQAGSTLGVDELIAESEKMV